MSEKSIFQIFDQYEKAKLNFVRTISELALRNTNIPILNSANVLDLLGPLLSDVSKQVQLCATLAVGRIIKNDHKMAGKFAEADLLLLLLKKISKEKT